MRAHQRLARPHGAGRTPRAGARCRHSSDTWSAGPRIEAQCRRQRRTRSAKKLMVSSSASTGHEVGARPAQRLERAADLVAEQRARLGAQHPLEEAGGHEHVRRQVRARTPPARRRGPRATARGPGYECAAPRQPRSCEGLCAGIAQEPPDLLRAHPDGAHTQIRPQGYSRDPVARRTGRSLAPAPVYAAGRAVPHGFRVVRLRWGRQCRRSVEGRRWTSRRGRRPGRGPRAARERGPWLPFLGWTTPPRGPVDEGPMTGRLRIADPAPRLGRSNLLHHAVMSVDRPEFAHYTRRWTERRRRTPGSSPSTVGDAGRCRAGRWSVHLPDDARVRLRGPSHA